MLIDAHHIKKKHILLISFYDALSLLLYEHCIPKFRNFNPVVDSVVKCLWRKTNHFLILKIYTFSPLFIDCVFHIFLSYSIKKIGSTVP